MNNRIRIIVSGQIANDTKYDAFVYPSAIGAEQISTQNNWRRSIFDPRSPGRALNSSAQIQATGINKIYAYWKNEVGNYYAIIVPAINKEGHIFNEGTLRDGRLMLSVFTEKYLFSSGRVVVDLLDKLEKHIIEEGKTNSSEVDMLLTGIEAYLIPDRRENVPVPSTLDAYRTYTSEEDLERIFQYPNQEEYNNYKHIFIVSSASLSTSIDANYQRINTPVKVAYNISNNLPQGVRVNTYTVIQGNILQISYSKPEYLPQPCKVRIDGTPNQYVSYSGNIVTIQDAETAGITFYRGLKINCYSGITPLGGIKVRYNGRDVTLGTDNLLVFDEDKTKYQIIVEASGYKSETVEVTLNDIRKGSKDVSLTPKDREVKIVISTPDRNVYDRITIPSNSPIYRYLKEAADRGIPINEYKIKRTDKNNMSNRNGQKNPSSIWKKIKSFLLSVLIAFVIGYLLIAIIADKAPWPFGDSSKETQEVINNDTTTVERESSPNDMILEAEDADSLKNRDVWDKSILKTDKFRTICDYLKEGQIESILRDDPFASYLEVNKVNGYWLQIMDELRRISSKPELMDKAKSVLRKIAKDDNHIDLQKMLSGLKIIKEEKKTSTSKEPANKVSGGKNGKNTGATSNSTPTPKKPAANRKGTNPNTSGPTTKDRPNSGIK